MKKEFAKIINEKVTLDKMLYYLSGEVSDTIKKIYLTLKKGGKVFLCGNGGSAADAQHLSAEFLVRLRPNINRRPLPVISLALDTSTITACGNDLGFDKLFARNLSALGSKKDLLIVKSTSGMSKNILNVLRYAKKMEFFYISSWNKGGMQKNYQI